MHKESSLKITKMDKTQLAKLDPGLVARPITKKEMIQIAKKMGAFWNYDYEAAAKGKTGYHAELKSKRHSEGFFTSAILLKRKNIMALMADQLVMAIKKLGIPKPDYIAGIPKGATKLGREVAKRLGIKTVGLKKINGVIRVTGRIKKNSTLLLVEDFITRGTGTVEAAKSILAQLDAEILPFVVALLNRGGKRKLRIDNSLQLKIAALVNFRVRDWRAADCPLCKLGSLPIKPKATKTNWKLINISQK